MWKMVRSRKQRVIGGLLALGAVAGAAVVATVDTPVSADTNPDIVYTQVGYVALETYSDGSARVARYANDGTPVGAPVSLGVTKASKCRATEPSNSLLVVSPDDPTLTGESVGVVSNGLGIRTKNTCSTDSGRIAPGQSLTFTLGSAFGSSARIDYATVDIEGKQNAQVAYLVDRRDGGNGAGSVALESTKASDNGPDAGAGDNSTETIGAVNVPDDDFTSLTFSSTAESGQFAIEGGGDYGDAAVLTRSTKFYVVTQTLGVECGDIVFVDFGSGPAGSATYTRGQAGPLLDENGDPVLDENGDPVMKPCPPIPVTLTQDATGVLLALDSDPVAVGSTMVINWEVERYAGSVLRDAASINAELAREISFNTTTPSFEAVQWCSNTTPEIGFPADTPWCLISDDQVLTASQILQTQTYVGDGDPYWK
jgi:hypothetical protein